MRSTRRIKRLTIEANNESENIEIQNAEQDFTGLIECAGLPTMLAYQTPTRNSDNGQLGSLATVVIIGQPYTLLYTPTEDGLSALIHHADGQSTIWTPAVRERGVGVSMLRFRKIAETDHKLYLPNAHRITPQQEQLLTEQLYTMGVQARPIYSPYFRSNLSLYRLDDIKDPMRGIDYPIPVEQAAKRLIENHTPA